MERLDNKQILGVIDATTDIGSLASLTLNRPVASLPFAGRYRLIDFMLSNMVNAGIDSVGIFSHSLNYSLKGHISSGKVWDLDRKNGGLFFYTQNEHESRNGQLTLVHNQEFFLRAPYPYVLVAPSNVVGNLPILDMLKNHKEKSAVVTQAISEGEQLPIYLINREILVDLLNNLDVKKPKSIMEFIEDGIENIKKNPYHVNSVLLRIDSLNSFYNNSMKLLDEDIWFKIFDRNAPVLTKVKDEPPTQHIPESKVTNSIVANGCIIKGLVNDSIISRGVKIGKNAVIRNSIIMPKVEIGDNCYLDGVIVDKDVIIRENSKLLGEQNDPFVVQKGVAIYKEWL